MGFMLASSVPWYLPVLFLSCLGWAFAFYVDGALNHRTLLQRLYRWTPPIMVAGLVASRTIDILSLSSTNPEVAYVLGQNASMGEQMRLLFTGQGALEGALWAFLSFALFAPSLPSLRGCSPDTSDFVRSRMMTHAGVWAVLLLMVLFQQDMYAPADIVPASPTVESVGWSSFLLVVLFTLLLMMSGEMLTASAHMASSGETSLLFQRAIIKTLVAGALAWACLFQSDLFSSTWWTGPCAMNVLPWRWSSSPMRHGLPWPTPFQRWLRAFKGRLHLKQHHWGGVWDWPSSSPSLCPQAQRMRSMFTGTVLMRSSLALSLIHI